MPSNTLCISLSFRFVAALPFLVSAAAVNSADIVSALNDGRWDNGASWSDGRVPSAGNNYFVLNGFSIQGPLINSGKPFDFVFNGAGLTVESGGILNLVSDSRADFATANYTIPGFLLESGATLELGLTAIGNVERRVVLPINIADTGEVVVRIDGYSGAYSNRLVLLPGATLSGGADLVVEIDSQGINTDGLKRRYIRVDSQNNSFSGDWVVSSSNISARTRMGGLIAGGKNALGSGGVFLSSSFLSNEIDGGLDSLREVGVGKDSMVILNGNWNSPGLSLALTGVNALVDLNGDGRRAVIGNLTGISGTTISGKSANQTFEVTSSLDTTFSGRITGAGLGFVKSGSKTLTFDSSQDYGRGTTITGGTLQLGAGGTSGAIIGDVISNGTLAFNRSDAVDFAGAISGVGNISHIGSGVTTLSGNSSAFAGVTTISNGTLWVNGTLGSSAHNLTALSGGVLGGTGTIGGNVSIKDGVLSPGNSVGTLNILGNFALDSASTLNYEFGEADAEGGMYNDLTNVGGNLQLDGVINVNVESGATLEPGVYRVINYSGSLVDNGLTLGSVPVSDIFVQTSIPSEVNLVYTGGLNFNFWDGEVVANKQNGSIEGGGGVWRSQAGNDNWTNYQGALNAPFADSSYAVFGGKPGVVNVDQSVGDINIRGAQFSVDGYQVKDGSLNMVADNTAFYVGEGTRAGAAITATIDSQLVGNAKLLKLGAGALVLNGDNTYTGGTRVRAGTVQISSDKNLGLPGSALEFVMGSLRVTQSTATDRPITIEQGANFLIDPSVVFESKNTITGAGALAKSGQGTMLLTGNSDYTGSTLVADGRLQAGGANKFSSASAFTVQPNGVLDLNGYNQSVAGLSNAGLVFMSRTAGVGLNVQGNYEGKGGIIAMASKLGNDSALTDLVTITGNSEGTTNLQISNAGGSGGITHNGIKVVDVQGTSAGVFKLLGDYEYEGEQAIVGGAYAYRLGQHSQDNPTDGDWYLKSSLLMDEPSPPLLQPGVPIYEAYANVLLSQNELDTYQQRTGTRQWLSIDSDSSTNNRGFWLRTEGSKTKQVPKKTTSDIDYTADAWKVQLGASAPLQETADSSLIADLALQYSQGNADIDSAYGDGDIKSKGYGVLGALTWIRKDGLYVDGQVQTMWYDSDLGSKLVGEKLKNGNKGFGAAASVEVGKSYPLSPSLSVTPQAQLTYSNVSVDDFDDVFGASVKLKEGDSLQARLGASLDYKPVVAADTAADKGQTKVYGTVNLYQELLGETKTEVSGLSLRNESDKTWAGVGAGVSHSWAGGQYTVFGELEARSSLADVGESYGATGSLGINIRW